jgi:hypothetical protein
LPHRDRSSSVKSVWYQTPGDGAFSGARHFVLTMPDIRVRDVNPSVLVRPAGQATGDAWHTVPGPWRFEFDLAISRGARLTPALSTVAHGVAATLKSILVTPTTDAWS